MGYQRVGPDGAGRGRSDRARTGQCRNGMARALRPAPAAGHRRRAGRGRVARLRGVATGVRVPRLPASAVRGRGVIVVRVFGREVFAVGRVGRSDGDGDATGAADLTGGTYELADYYPGRHE